VIVPDEWRDPDAVVAPTQPTPFGDALAALVRRSGWGSRLEGAQVHQRWSEIAGEVLARHVQPVRLVGGVLVLRADSSAWAAQVRLLTGELAARADAVLGPGSVRRVTITTGRHGSNETKRR